MAITLYHVGRTPSQNQFGLDTFTEHYKAAEAADMVMVDASVPAMSAAHPDYPYMFVTARYCTETGPNASALDITYTGCMGGDESPTLPAAQTRDSDQVMSASSSRNVAGQTMTNPVSVEFYAPSIVYTWFTYNAKGTKGTGPTPSRDVEIITVTIGDTTFSFGTSSIEAVVNNCFSRRLTDTIDSQEIVAGKFWQNTETRTTALVPYYVELSPGFYPAPYSGGTGYTYGDTITLSFSGTCVMTVAAVDGAGRIFAATIVSNSLSAATGTPQTVTGGTGSGASYTVIEIT